MNYTYYSLKQLEADIMDLPANLSKLTPGITINEVTINISPNDYITCIRDINTKQKELMEQYSPDTPITEKDLLPEDQMGIKMNFTNLIINLIKSTEDETSSN